MSKLSDIGEFGFIKRFSPHFLKSLPEGISGIGDDCAVIRLNETESMLVTTDMLIEDRHFLLHKITPFELGYKSLAVNLSDIAAMGGRPESAFLSIGVPSKMELSWLDEFFRGIQELCSKTGTYLLGGDTTGSPDRLVINIAVIGRADNRYIKMRSAAQPGQIICVTDFIGDSGGGLKILLKKDSTWSDDENYLVRRHHMPQPDLKEGQWLAMHAAVGAMQDVSDGVESDVRRIMEQSNVGARIDLEKLPISETLKRVCVKNKWDALPIALSGGEDYCLLFTVEKDEFPHLNEDFQKAFGTPLHEIGSIISAADGMQIYHNGGPAKLSHHGYDHFKS